MTEKSRISTEFDEIMEYLDVDREELRKAVKYAVKVIGKRYEQIDGIDNSIDAYLRTDLLQKN